MISTHYELTDMGKRQLLRELSYELTDKKIAEIVAQFADCLKVDRHGDALIEIDGNDIDCCVTKIFPIYIESHHFEKVTVCEEDGNE